jgi:tetratricopeptide (TPR) repeat protein
VIGFGFGFNKAKVLAAAEKNVKQGKLHAAIAEYEKVVKEDPKDLNVLNTIGDLYARVGNTEQAVDYFRRVGDAYASDGFTVKSIAMYKKLTKLSPTATNAILKLAELYTQNGLYNDARAQYMQVADQHMRMGELDKAAGIFQKMLELDPDNAIMQSRLAELYVKLGKKSEARDIYYRAAESLRQRGALDAADDALAHVVELDPSFTQAIITRGQVKLDSGDAEGALEVLQHMPDLDSRPDALRSIFKARLQLGHLQDAEPIAKKLLTVFNDPACVFGYIEATIATREYEAALKFYREHAETLLAANPQLVIESLRGMVGKVKTSVRALEMLAELFRIAGETSQLTEVTELLAHAYVQSGELERARELYKWLAEEEPENPLHAQNYKQVLGRLGQDTLAKQFTAEEGTQAFMVDELQTIAPEIDQKYASSVEEAIRAALTDSELFDSYNLANRAIQPLENVLRLAPLDTNINQRLASLYARTGKMAEAAQRCAILNSVYKQAGLEDEAAKYGDVAAKYAERAGLSLNELNAAAQQCISRAAQAGPSQVFGSTSSELGETIELNAEEFASPAPVEEDAAPAQLEDVPAAPEFAVEPPEASPDTAESVSHEIDLSSEWDRMVQAEPQAEPLVEPVSSLRQTVWEDVEPQPAAAADVADVVEEIRFYLSQSMWQEARAAIERCDSIAPEYPELADFKAELAKGSAPQIQDIEILDEEPLPGPETAPASAPVFEVNAQVGEPLVTDEWPSVRPTSLLQTPEEPVAKPEPLPVSASTADELGGLVTELEDTLGDVFAEKPATTSPSAPAPAMMPTAAPPAVMAAAAAPAMAPVAPEAPTATAAPPTTEQGGLGEFGGGLSDVFAEFKEDMESSTTADEDPEMHYNLGMAFREMGLLDEAIGELQKVCQIVERGHPFGKLMQAYTWLAGCFVEKGVAEAGIRWYEKALKCSGIDDETATAIHYELGSAYEQAGNKKAALSHFMEVYGTNIDYRDVAERIKALKS